MPVATQEQAEAIFNALRERDAERQARLPATRSALDHACMAKQRLGDLGWRDGIYCPKDGTTFALVQWGSTGVHSGHYMGEWPRGHVYCGDFLISPEGLLWKAIDKLTDDEREALAASDRDVADFMERQVRMFAPAAAIRGDTNG